MKRKPKPTSPPTVEEKIVMIKALLNQYLDPCLLKKHTYEPRDPSVKWSFGLTNTDQMNDQYELTLTIRYGAMRGYTKETVRGWYRLECVTAQEVINALFHSLTWASSPYWFDGEQWHKRMEIMG